MDTTLELLEKICMQYGLGGLVRQPERLQGGFLHRMYSLFTTKGRYAVKLLNPYIMQRETAMDNYRRAERLEKMLEETDIPILPALCFAGSKMQKIGGQFFYLYEWYDGRALRSDEITEAHCRRMGQLLAGIHGVDRRKETYLRDEIHVDWDAYIDRLSVQNTELGRLLQNSRNLLYACQDKGNAAVKRLPRVVTVCHNDMDSKNVLWAGSDCRIIDLECLGYASPFSELYETALYWCGYENCRLEDSLLRSFVGAYAEAGGQLPTDWETVYWGSYGRLEWLEYNVKRALGIECTAEETAVGISEVKRTMAQVVYYAAVREDILNWLEEIQHSSRKRSNGKFCW